MLPELRTAQADSLYEARVPAVSRLANILCLLYESSDQINWVGLYLYDESSGSCFLGPFFGKPACMEIRKSKGVIGAAIDRRQTLRVDDVLSFDGHIACDAASRSECVILLRKPDGSLMGVLDVDALCTGFFSEQDQRILETVSCRIEALAGCIIL